MTVDWRPSASKGADARVRNQRTSAPATADGVLEEAAAEALRSSGGALPIAHLRARLESGGAAREPLARCLRGRGDLFLLLEPRADPWREHEWTPAERSEYEMAAHASEAVLLLDGSAGSTAPGVPAMLRESLLSMWGESPDDDQLRRELARSVSS